MTLLERNNFIDSNKEEVTTDDAGISKTYDFGLTLLAQVWCDSDGDLLFTKEEMQNMSATHDALLQEVAYFAAEICGFTNSAREKIKKK